MWWCDANHDNRQSIEEPHTSHLKWQAMLGALPLLLALLLAGVSTTAAFKLPLRMVGDSRKGQQVRIGSDGLLRFRIDLITDRKPNQTKPHHSNHHVGRRQ
jgi:hypothetical protein